MRQSDAADHTGAKRCFALPIQENDFSCDCMQKRSGYHCCLTARRPRFGSRAGRPCVESVHGETMTHAPGVRLTAVSKCQCVQSSSSSPPRRMKMYVKGDTAICKHYYIIHLQFFCLYNDFIFHSCTVALGGLYYS